MYSSIQVFKASDISTLTTITKRQDTQMMDLSSSFHFEGWDVRYALLQPVLNDDNASGRSKTKCVVFVHGTPWSSAVYKPVIEALLARGTHQILVYDLPGYGQSQSYDNGSGSDSTHADFEGDTSVKFQGKALAALLEHARMDGHENRPAPAVIAHDIAGTIVLRAHLIHNCEFDTMMLLDTNCVLPWGDGFYTLVRSQPQTFLDLPPKIFESVVREVIRSACHNPKVLQSGWEDILLQPWTGPLSATSRTSVNDEQAEAEQQKSQRSFVRQIAQADDANVAEMLDANMYEHIRCDVKIMWGEQDQWIPRHKIEDLAQRITKGKVKECVFIPQAGHLIMLDQPTRFAIEVYDWLTRFGSSRSCLVS